MALVDERFKLDRLRGSEWYLRESPLTIFTWKKTWLSTVIVSILTVVFIAYCISLITGKTPDGDSLVNYLWSLPLAVLATSGISQLSATGHTMRQRIALELVDEQLLLRDKQIAELRAELELLKAQVGKADPSQD